MQRRYRVQKHQTYGALIGLVFECPMVAAEQTRLFQRKVLFQCRYHWRTETMPISIRAFAFVRVLIRPAPSPFSTAVRYLPRRLRRFERLRAHGNMAPR